MKHLIVNADDFGCDIYRNLGIKEAITKGIVRSISILPNGPAITHGIKILRLLEDKKISVGVHINLSEGKPVSKNLRYIVREDGNFLSKERALQFFSSPKDKKIQKEIETEIDTQIKTILNYGLYISHIDGHHHIHIMPAVIDTVIKKAREYSIKWIRIPYEPSNPYRTVSTDRCIENKEAQFFSRCGKIARDILKKEGIRHPDHFIGLYMKGKITKKLLMEVIENLQDGVTEMMVHPGFMAPFDPDNPFTNFSCGRREIELNCLIQQEVFNLIEDNKIHLTSFTEV